MCDTLCALLSWSVTGHTDCQEQRSNPNEPHVILHIPARLHEAAVTCGVPTSRSHRFHAPTVLLFAGLIWGAVMGVNEFGVAIGNEAVFTRAKKEKAGSIGMISRAWRRNAQTRQNLPSK